MNKKKLILTIVIDLLVVAVLVASIYLLMFKDLNQWQNNIATALVVIAFPTIFYSIFTQVAANKYGKLKDKDDKLWDELGETIELEEKEEDIPRESKSAT